MTMKKKLECSEETGEHQFDASDRDGPYADPENPGR